MMVTNVTDVGKCHVNETLKKKNNNSNSYVYIF